MVAQSQVREGLCEIRLRYRSFVSHHAPHVCEMRRSSRTAANAATRGKCCHLPVTPRIFVLASNKKRQRARGRPQAEVRVSRLAPRRRGTSRPELEHFT